MQASGQNFVNFAKLQIGLELARPPLRLSGLVVGHIGQIVHHAFERGVQRAGHVSAQNQEFGHALGFDDIAVDLAVNFKTADAAQNSAPMVKIHLLVFVLLGGDHIVLQGMKLHIYQSCGVVSPF